MSITQQTLDTFLDNVAAKNPTPGGGAVAAAVGALSAALAGMVIAYTTGKKNFAQHETELAEMVAALRRARSVMFELAEEDERAYADLNALMKLDEASEERRSKMPADARLATQIPLAVMAAAVDLLRRFERMTTITNPRLRSDLAIAAVLADAVARASMWNVAINLPSLETDDERNQADRTARAMLADAARLTDDIETACR